MYIRSIRWIDQIAFEAEIEVTDGNFSINCYSIPCSYQPGQCIGGYLECLDAENVVKMEKETFLVLNRKKPFYYYLCGKVTDCKEGKIKIGDLKLRMDSRLIPGDIQNGDCVSFCTCRVDVW